MAEFLLALIAALLLWERVEHSPALKGVRKIIQNGVERVANGKRN